MTLCNLKTAAKDGVQSTGNAAKGSYKSAWGWLLPICIFNPHCQLGDIAGVQRGLVIIDPGHLPGPTRFGRFWAPSLPGGEGKIVTVNQITIAGNFISML